MGDRKLTVLVKIQLLGVNSLKKGPWCAVERWGGLLDLQAEASEALESSTGIPRALSGPIPPFHFLIVSVWGKP